MGSTVTMSKGSVVRIKKVTNTLRDDTFVSDTILGRFALFIGIPIVLPWTHFTVLAYHYGQSVLQVFQRIIERLHRSTVGLIFS